MTVSARESRLFVAIVAALMILVQTFGTAHAMGTMPYGQMLDAFGNPLCITNPDGSSGVPGNGNPARFADCCTLGCSSMSPVLVAPERAPIVEPVPAIAAIGWFVTARRGGVSERKHDPASPRAPPLQA